MTDTIFGPTVIELASGAGLDLRNPDPRAVTLHDVARGLSHTCRFAGQTKRFYSVAEHAVLVAEHLADMDAAVDVQLAGLHHDDAEAFLGDLTRQLKLLLPGYAGLEREMQVAIRCALGMPEPDPDTVALVKLADDWALAAEAHSLLRSAGAGWFCDGLFNPHRPGAAACGLGMEPDAAERAYLETHRLLVGEGAQCA